MKMLLATMLTSLFLFSSCAMSQKGGCNKSYCGGDKCSCTKSKNCSKGKKHHHKGDHGKMMDKSDHHKMQEKSAN